MINNWWAEFEEEKYWLEVTDREDIGANLKAPQSNERGAEFWSYSLLTHVRQGDLVFHYDRNRQTIMASSVAATKAWEDTIVWAARGQSARAAGIEPHRRAGWQVGLERYSELASPLTLNDIRAVQPELVTERNRLQARVEGALYFPFELGAIRPLRPMQGYLFKLPSFFVDMFPQLGRSSSGRRLGERSGGIGSRYRRANTAMSVGERDPFAVDPSLVERGLRGHAETQNSLAAYLEEHGITPLSPAPADPNYDLAWISAGSVWVAEVKSITEANEEQQLRLGLGQLLRYRQLLCAIGPTQAVLAVEQRPTDNLWHELCRELDIVLVWPPEWDQRLVR